MRPTRRPIAILILGALIAVPAAAESYRIFKRDRSGLGFTCPQVEYNPARGGFLVLGREGHAVKSRLVERDSPEHDPWMPPAVSHRFRYEPRLAYSAGAGGYLLSSGVYTRLDQDGRRVGADLRYPTFFGPRTLALAAIAGRDTWFAVVEGCKYGCIYEGYVVGRGGMLRQFVDLWDLPFDDQYANFNRRFQAGFDSENRSFLVLWEDGYDDDYEGPSNAILAQRLRSDGRYLGRRLKIATHARNASQPHLFYNEARAEWLVVFRDGRWVKGRFLRGGRLSRPFKIGSRGDVPSIAYAADRGAYLVTWIGADRSGGLYGRWVRADGEPLGRPFSLLEPKRGATVRQPGYTACSGGGDCLVTWVDDRWDGTTRARFVTLAPDIPSPPP